MTLKIKFVDGMYVMSDDEDVSISDSEIIEKNYSMVLKSTKDYKPPKILKTVDSCTLEWFSSACLIEMFFNTTDDYRWTVTSFVHNTSFSGLTKTTDLDKIVDKALLQYFLLG